MFDDLLAEVIKKAVKAASSPAEISIKTDGGLFGKRKVTIEGESANVFALSSILVAHVVKGITQDGDYGNMLESIMKSAEEYLRILERGEKGWNQ